MASPKVHFLRLDSIPSCNGFHTMLCIDSIHAFGVMCRTSSSPYENSWKYLFCRPSHKETIILIRKISVLWLFLLQKWGWFALFHRFYSKNEGLPGCFSSSQVFLFLAVKYKSFILYPFRSIYRVSFNFCVFINFFIFYPKTIEMFSQKVYNKYAKQNRIK